MSDTAPPAVIETPNAPLTAEAIPAAVPTGITEVTIGTGPIDAAAELGLTLPKVLGPEKLLGEDPEQTADDFAAATGGERRARDPQTGKFLPKEGEPAKPAAKAKPVAKVAAPVLPKAPDPAPVVAAKVKIGDVEKTPEEWAAHVKDLEAKANAPKLPETPAAPAKPDPTPEERTAAQQKADADFINGAATDRYQIKPEEFDQILAGGPEAAKQFSAALAKVEMNARKFAAAHLNEVHAMLEPVLAHQRQIAAYQAEQGFLAANADIAANPAGADKYREINSAHHDYYDAVQQKIAQNTASPTERAWATIFDAMTPEQFHADIASKTRAALGSLPTPVAAPIAPEVVPKAAPKAPVARATPLNGDRPGGVTAPSTQTAEAKLAAAVMNYNP